MIGCKCICFEAILGFRDFGQDILKKIPITMRFIGEFCLTVVGHIRFRSACSSEPGVASVFGINPGATSKICDGI